MSTAVGKKLRQYQIDALDTIHNDFRYEKNVLLQMVTGAGKTFTVCRMISKYYRETNKNFLILVHKQELIKQFKETIDVPAGICCAGLGLDDLSKRVTIATIQTFIKKLDVTKKYDLLVIDEVHRVSIGANSQYEQVIDYLRAVNPDMRLLGLTATPARLDHGYIYGDKCAGENLFPRLNHRVKYSELLSAGYLAELKGLVAAHELIEKDLSTIKINGDYVIDQLGEVMSLDRHVGTAADAINKYCSEYKHICVFCCTIDHAIKVYDHIKKEATLIHSKLTQNVREHNLNLWKSGTKRIIVGVNILAEGFDFPALDCIVIARPTLSPVLYLQVIGRVLRVAQGKQHGFILDLTDNTSRFGTNIDEIKIKIPDKVVKAAAQYEKLCPMCNNFVHVSRAECPECGYEFKNEEINEAETLPELKGVEFTGGSDNIIEKPVWHNVGAIFVAKHKKNGKPPSMRVDYYADETYLDRICSEWVCFEHEGYARRKACDWWIDMVTRWYDDPVPDTVDDAMGHTFIAPKKIKTIMDGKYKKILKREHDDVPF